MRAPFDGEAADVRPPGSAANYSRSRGYPRVGMGTPGPLCPILAPTSRPSGAVVMDGANAVGGTADRAEEASALAKRLGIGEGSTVQELGYDTDTDDLVAEAVVVGSGEDAVDEDYDGVVDMVVLWWREDDGDLADALVDAKAPIASSGVIWLFTPKFGRPGALEPADIADAASTSGLRRTTSVTLQAWQGVRMVSR